jgi:hypothetical protein
MGILRCVGNAVSFLDVLSAVPPFLSRARKSKPAERRDRSQSMGNYTYSLAKSS